MHSSDAGHRWWSAEGVNFPSDWGVGKPCALRCSVGMWKIWEDAWCADK